MSKLKKDIRDGHTRSENLTSQPLKHQKVFNSQGKLTKGWFPVCPSKEIGKKGTYSFSILNQRVALYRGEDGKVRALDAFCPHLGTDLSNGDVIGNNIRCYFHQWELNESGNVCKIKCREEVSESLKKIKNNSYPTQELYGHIWVFSDSEKNHDLPHPSTMEDEKVSAIFIKEIYLYAHHHIMMANGIDLQHFAAVHNLDIKFSFEVKDHENGIFEWTLEGKIPTDNIKGKLARFFLGENFKYHVKFAGGSIVSITYGSKQKFLGCNLPSLQILWACTPLANGLSKVKIFFITKNRRGIIGKIINAWLYFLTAALIWLLRDEDIQAFPNMRFNTDHLLKEDESLAKFISSINKLELSKWGDTNER
jgi:phenylpropionate dioxygenase-like ring-hydroxylating dioxygenase large terminal subunit